MTEREIIEDFIYDKCRDAMVDGVVLGVSGGIDSTVTLKLCVNAIGNNRVLGIVMPSGVSDIDNMKDAIDICLDYQVTYGFIPINTILDSYNSKLNILNKKIKGNLMTRVRMNILYYYANKYNLLVAGTSNRSELLQGYGTLHGDLACDFMPIGDLYKTEVRELAKELSIPDKIINKTPSAGLWLRQEDEKELGITYDKLDVILKKLSLGWSVSRISMENNITFSKVKEVLDRAEKTRFKREVPYTPSKYYQKR